MDPYNRVGAGDQGMVFGYACDETEQDFDTDQITTNNDGFRGRFMPLPISLAHDLTKKLDTVRTSGTIPWLGPDGKSQVTIAYEDGKPSYIDTVLISAQHLPDISMETIREALIEEVIKDVCPGNLLNAATKYLVNPTGRFVTGGPMGDAGLTGRKIIVDTYGGAARHGGGAFSGKDPSKVDRSAAYAARHVAKNIVAAGLASRLEVQISYAIGIAQPVSVLVDSFGTAVSEDFDLAKVVDAHFDLRPGAIIERFDLTRPIYQQTASYGHFGRNDLELPWEQIDMAESLREFR
jgi:S-adenosylmethionine synthetase